MLKLTSENVHRVMMDSLFHDGEVAAGEIPKEYVEALGVVQKVGFHPQRLELHRQDVIELLSQLPEQFNARSPSHPEGGAGWSFLNSVTDRDGNQWSGHKNAEALLMLGLGLKLVEYNMPRDMWSALPGGVPYFTILAPKA
jgi:hypothetical protein